MMHNLPKFATSILDKYSETTEDLYKKLPFTLSVEILPLQNFSMQGIVHTVAAYAMC